MHTTAHTPSSDATAAQAMVWTDSLHTGDVRMDETHREFTDMINLILAGAAFLVIPSDDDIVAMAERLA